MQRRLEEVLVSIPFVPHRQGEEETPSIDRVPRLRGSDRPFDGNPAEDGEAEPHRGPSLQEYPVQDLGRGSFREEEAAEAHLRVPRRVKVLDVGAGEIAPAAVVIRVVSQIKTAPPVEMEGKGLPPQFARVPRKVLVQGSEVPVAPSRILPLVGEKVGPGGKSDVCGTARSGKKGWQEKEKKRATKTHPQARAHPVSKISHRFPPSYCRYEPVIAG